MDVRESAVVVVDLAAESFQQNFVVLGKREEYSTTTAVSNAAKWSIILLAKRQQYYTTGMI
jgi:hypothetical protein